MKIEVINTRYPDGVPNGTIMTVTHKYGNGGFDATVDGGNGFEWFIPADMYRVIPDIKREVSDTPTTGTLAELNVKPGDVVEFVGDECSGFSIGKQYDCVEGVDGFGQNAIGPVNENGGCIPSIRSSLVFHIISRASDEPASDDTPKTWADMTDAEKGGSATMEAIEYIDEVFDSNLAQRMRDELGIKPEPKRETVTVTGGHDGVEWCFGEGPASTDTHRITFDTIDGEPDLDSIKMEKL